MFMQPRLPLNNLNAFAAAAEFLSFQEAAETLFVTPSAVSHQIRNLEKLLGYKLFNRLDKGIKLSSLGEKLYADIRIPMKQIHEASRKAQRGSTDNALALSVAPVFATGWLLSRLNDFYAHHPDINLAIIATADLADFDSDSFDASIRMGAGDWQKTKSISLFNKEIVAVCHPSMLKENKALFTALEIAGLRLIQNTSMPGLWGEWFSSTGMEDISSKGIKLQLPSSAQVVEVLQSGNSVGLIDRNFITNDIESGRLAIACDHVLHGEDGYFLTYPDVAENQSSFQSFKGWLCKQLDLKG